ncbi:nuclease-related domain-containing protein [Granulicella sp. dw_53]|uniref:nuclease-related domain-containing protein n=1 Tax=Granulicella sp. dw_53 TaxID=2719792 RepID=UPI001BD21FAB|nr:nuclease-related domain-containing protein [Granulicella sp. dw_53]
MAEMVPAFIDAGKKASQGEREIFVLLRDALVPHEGYIVWYEPTPAANRTDFLVWFPKRGLLVIEVKDWSNDYIQDFDPLRWTVHGKWGLRKELNPAEQARTSNERLRDLLEESEDLRQGEGDYLGKLRFPVNHCVAFTRLTRQQAENREGLIQTLGSTYCLFSDDLIFDVADEGSRNRFEATLQRCLGVKFNFEPLSDEQMKTLRKALFPKASVNMTQTGTTPKNVLPPPFHPPQQLPVIVYSAALHARANPRRNRIQMPEVAVVALLFLLSFLPFLWWATGGEMNWDSLSPLHPPVADVIAVHTCDVVSSSCKCHEKRSFRRGAVLYVQFLARDSTPLSGAVRDAAGISVPLSFSHYKHGLLAGGCHIAKYPVNRHGPQGMYAIQIAWQNGNSGQSVLSRGFAVTP